MDLLVELESMALAVGDDGEIDQTDIQRWQTLFAMSEVDARYEIEQYRGDLGRRKVPDDLWDSVRAEKEAEGHDRESYEYSLTLHATQPKARPIYNRTTTGTYLVQLAGPLNNPSKLQEAAGLSMVPRVVTAYGDLGNASFCEIDALGRQGLMSWLTTHSSDFGNFKPTIVRLAKAQKDLERHSAGPFLGKDTTLPQYRAVAEDRCPQPEQDEYPVWYFFYGTLADPEVLRAQLGLDEVGGLKLIPAFIRGAKLRTWAQKYRALVDDLQCPAIVHGSAFLVSCREHEDTLRFYETDKYEVVRCNIVMGGDEVPGLTFRFAGSASELDDV